MLVDLELAAVAVPSKEAVVAQADWAVEAVEPPVGLVALGGLLELRPAAALEVLADSMSPSKSLEKACPYRNLPNQSFLEKP